MNPIINQRIKDFSNSVCSNASIHYHRNCTGILSSFPFLRIFIPIQSIPIQSQKKPLLHVRARSIRLRRHRLALDALSAGIVVLRVLADAGRARVGSNGSLARALAFGVAGGVVGAETVLLGLLLLELLAGAGTAAGGEC